MKIASLFYLLTLLLSHCYASTVLWDKVMLYDNVSTEGRFSLKYYHDVDPIIPNHSFFVDLSVDVHRDGINTTLTANPHDVVLSFMGNWVVATLGDIAMESTTRHLADYFMHCYTDGESPTLSATSLSVNGSQNVYLMFSTSGFGETPESDYPYYYGWVELLIDRGTVSLTHSAIDLDGGPIIVGGGSTIPEPSSVLLLLVGGALLALKRRRDSPTSYVLRPTNPEIW